MYVGLCSVALEPGSEYCRLRESNLCKEALVSDAVERLGETVGSHSGSADVLDLEVAVADALLDVVVVDVDVLSTLVVSVSVEELDGRLVVAVQKNGVSVVCCVAKLV
jgi:hypothetical protein